MNATRLWNWLGRVTCPNGWFLFYAPMPVRRLSSWWLQWWGWCFMYTKPWRPGSLDDE